MATRSGTAAAGRHLRKDPILAPLVRDAALQPLKKVTDLPLYLYRTIINQQLSTRAGDAIFTRFLALFSPSMPDAGAVLGLPPKRLRSIGLSAAKAGYIRNVAQFHLDESLTRRRFSQLDDEAAIAFLTRIKGIGRWTAEIFLIAALGREDVFPADDLILQKYMRQLYGIGAERKGKHLIGDMQELAAQWRPFRSYACRCLWQWEGR